MNLLPLAVATLLIAFFTGSDSLFYLTYALVGIGVLSRVWTRRALAGVRAERNFTPRAFHGEKIWVDLKIKNRSRLPVLWLHLHESLPIALHVPNFEQRVVSLAPGQRVNIRYELNCVRRGYYQLGPLHLQSGDMLGAMPDSETDIGTNPLIVYPRIIPLRQIGIPSQLPFGNIASRERIFEDPSRFFGVRDYQPSDSLRQINWKSSARMDELQVKRFQPAIALHTMIFLDLNTEVYSLRSRAMAGEMGIVVAASIAAHLIEKRQQVGLSILGIDAVTGAIGLEMMQPGHGRGHLMRLLEALARANMATTTALPTVLSGASANLSWGSTAIVITPGNQPGVMPVFLQMRRQGLNLLLIATDHTIHFESFRDELKRIGIPAYWVTQDGEMDIWR